MRNGTIFLLLWVCGTAEAADRFWQTFGDGKAELSSYRVVQPRYGEPRDGHAVLIFVPEHVHARTRIKIENYAATPEKDRVQVLKLNRALYFTTGIYPYSVVTSVFQALGKKWPEKLSITANEWCGNFYEHMLPEPAGAKRVRHSYFEGEGDREDFLKAPEGGIYEDTLLVLIRELQGEWLKDGEKREVSLLGSLWSSRITHRDHLWEKGWIKKETVKAEKRVKWSWRAGTREMTYWVGIEYPHYILEWKGSDGESGKRMKTLHLPYWEHNHNADLKLRKELGLGKTG